MLLVRLRLAPQPRSLVGASCAVEKTNSARTPRRLPRSPYVSQAQPIPKRRRIVEDEEDEDNDTLMTNIEDCVIIHYFR